MGSFAVFSINVQSKNNFKQKNLWLVVHMEATHDFKRSLPFSLCCGTGKTFSSLAVFGCNDTTSKHLATWPKKQKELQPGFRWTTRRPANPHYITLTEKVELSMGSGDGVSSVLGCCEPTWKWQGPARGSGWLGGKLSGQQSCMWKRDRGAWRCG